MSVKHGAKVNTCSYDIALYLLSAEIFCTSLKALVMVEIRTRTECLDGNAAVRGCHVGSTAAKEATLTSVAQDFSFLVGVNPPVAASKKQPTVEGVVAFNQNKNWSAPTKQRDDTAAKINFSLRNQCNRKWTRR